MQARDDRLEEADQKAERKILPAVRVTRELQIHSMLVCAVHLARLMCEQHERAIRIAILGRAREILAGMRATSEDDQAVTASRGSVPSKLAPTTGPAKEPWWETLLRHTGVDVRACPRCKTGRLVRREIVPAVGLARSPPGAA